MRARRLEQQPGGTFSSHDSSVKVSIHGGPTPRVTDSFVQHEWPSDDRSLYMDYNTSTCNCIVIVIHLYVSELRKVERAEERRVERHTDDDGRRRRWRWRRWRSVAHRLRAVPRCRRRFPPSFRWTGVGRGRPWVVRCVVRTVDPAARLGDLMTMLMTTTRADGDRDGRLRKAAMGECLRRRTTDPRDAVDVPVVGVVRDGGDDAGGRRRATGGTLG